MAGNLGRFLDQCIETLHGPVDASFLQAMNEHFEALRIEDLGAQGTSKLRILMDLLVDRVLTEDSIKVLSTILSRYAQSSLTPVHSVIVQQCCRLRCYDLAVSLLSRPIESFPASNHLTYRDHLSYHFWGGLCFVALQDWANALRLFALVLTTGGTSTSLIQLEAYRKYILVSLVQHGYLVPEPSTLSSSTRRSLETLTPEYLELANQYKRNPDGFQSLVVVHREVIRGHGNEGLLNAVVASVIARKVIAMQDIYSSLPLAALAVKLNLGVSEAVSLVQSLIRQGRITARIDDSGVDFERHGLEPAEQLARLEEDRRAALQLRERMALLQRTLELDTSHIGKKGKAGFAQESESARSRGKGGRAIDIGPL